MVYVNPAEHISDRIRPDADTVLGIAPEVIARDANALYHRQHELRSQGIQNAINNQLITDADTLTIDQYQQWVELAWKTPQGTQDSLTRLDEKVFEELDELFEAIKLDQKHGYSTESKLSITQELGDVLWTNTGAAFNAGTNVDMALRVRMYQYVMGIRMVDGPNSREPSWRAGAIAVATAFDSIPFGALDHVIEQGFDAYPSPVMNIFDDEPETTDDVLTQLSVRILALHNATRQQYLADVQRDEDTPVEIRLYSDFEARAREYIDPLIADIYLLIGVLGLRTAGVTMVDIISENVRKVSQRIATNRIDKADGDRPLEH